MSKDELSKAIMKELDYDGFRDSPDTKLLRLAKNLKIRLTGPWDKEDDVPDLETQKWQNGYYGKLEGEG